MDYLRRLREEEMELPPGERMDYLEKAIEEHALLISHEEEVAVPENLPEEIVRRLDHGRALALSRAADVREVIAKIVDRADITRLPERMQVFHKDYAVTIGKEKTEEALKLFGFDNEPTR